VSPDKILIVEADDDLPLFLCSVLYLAGLLFLLLFFLRQRNGFWVRPGRTWWVVRRDGHVRGDSLGIKYHPVVLPGMQGKGPGRQKKHFRCLGFWFFLSRKRTKPLRQ
jgi:hypothetical protein